MNVPARYVQQTSIDASAGQSFTWMRSSQNLAPPNGRAREEFFLSLTLVAPCAFAGMRCARIADRVAARLRQQGGNVSA
jgi:hypothetical protein